MSFKDVKVQHIYFANFDRVRNYEFNGEHLVVVMKKNDDDRMTCAVMPLTSASDGLGTRKILLGKLNCLPAKLRINNSYAVFNQIRTLNVSRFKPVLDNNMPLTCKIDDEIFKTLQIVAMQNIAFNMSDEDKLEVFHNLYIQEKVKQASGIAYEIIRLEKQINSDREKISELEQKIASLLLNCDISKINIEPDIAAIFQRKINEN